MMLYVYIYLIIVSVLGIFLTLYDKDAAASKKRIISEKAFFLLSILGATLPIYFSMKTIRHKTRHKRFMIGLPVIFVLQMTLFFYLLHLGVIQKFLI